MKIWTSEHTFEHNWATVVQAALRKYPNPLNTNVVGLDVISRNVGKDGVLRSHRLMQTAWGLPEFLTSIVGMNRVCHVSEHSELNPRKKTMKMTSRNLTFCNFITVDEKLEYTQHPNDPTKTLLKQEAVVGIQGIPMASYFEGVVKGTISSNAGKGRQGIEWVIGNIAEETLKLSRSAEEQMDTLKTATLKHIHTAEEQMDSLKHTLSETNFIPTVNAETKKL